jgi:hypothetical protein
MDGHPCTPAPRLSARRIAIAWLALAAVGCGKPTWWPIRPFGSVRSYNETVVPGPKGHPRGQMVQPQAPGIDLVRDRGPLDSATRPASAD